MIDTYLKELTQLTGVSSREDEVIDYIFQKFRLFSEKVSVDTLGNVIAKIPSNQKNAKKLMLFGHMDEIGFIVRKIELNGFLRIERIGGVSTQILPGMVLDILGSRGKVKGVIGTPSHHFIKADDKFSVPQVAELYVDIGASSKAEAQRLGVDVGCFAAFEPRYIELCSDKICAKALDDRAALAVLLEFLEQTQNQTFDWDIYVVAAVMEEFNIRGIMPVVRTIQPDAMLGLDITPACDTPDMNYNDIALGSGPAVTYMNFHGRGTLAGVLPDEKMLKYLEKICSQHQIPYQKEVAPGVITENAFALFENSGIAVCSLSIPTRYTHTPIECISRSDLNNIL
ncbi:MAG: M42 family metallopeptidase, partial [Lachnospiraceae bacterium]